MSTRGSIAIVRQRYRRKRQTREPPEHVGHPGVADHVGLDGEDERRAERGSEPGLTSKQYAEDAKAPRNPDKPAEQAGLHPELRVVRLARLDRRLRPRRRLARVAQAETLRVVDERLARRERAVRIAGMELCLCTLLDEILLRPMPRRRD